MVQIKSIKVFYFTGTGNSGKVAEWITQVANENKIPFELNNVGKGKPLIQSETDLLKTTHTKPYIIFIAPTHGFNYPPLMIKFLLRFPKGENPVALVNTRGGMRIGTWVTPGLSGIALFFGALILKLKGYKIHSLFPVDMPSNWISLHPGLSRQAVTYLHLINRVRVHAFARKIISGQRVNRGYWDIVQDLIISPISILYYFIGRFFFSKSFFATSNCTNCGLCIRECPVKAIQSIQKRPFWTYKCESCMHCINNCPEKAIQTGHGYLIGLSILYTSVLIGLFYRSLEGIMINIDNHLIEFIINNGLFILYLFLGYRIIHYLFRFKFFSKLAEFTSLTRYKFWGRRYKALKDKDFIST